MQSLIEQLKEKQEAEQQAARDDWKQLVADVADGTKLNADKAVAVLAANHCTADDLQAAAELLIQRREWAATLHTESAAVEARRVARQRKQQVAELFKKQDAERTALRHELDQEDGRVSGMFREINEARKKLLESIPPELRAREAELQQQRIAAVGDQLEAIEAELKEIEAIKLEP